MDNDRLSYVVLENEYMTNWLTSEVISTPFAAKMVPTVFENYHPGASVKTADGKERISPAKEEFLENARFCKSGFPYGVAMENLYWPFDTQRVDFSGFWHFPCDITFYAIAYVVSAADCAWQVELCTCGAMKVWVNGRENASFHPYESNLEAKQAASLSLQAGINEIVVGCNNYGERNIVFNFGIKNLSRPVEVFLPISADIAKLRSVNVTLDGMYLDKLSYSQGNIVICTDCAFDFGNVLKVDVCGLQKEFAVDAGCSAIIWGDAGELPIGYHEFTINCVVDSIPLRKALWAEVYPIDLEVETPDSFEGRKQLALDFIIKNTQPGLEQYIAYLEKGENRYDEFREIIEDVVTHVRHRGDCSDFRVVKLLWVLKRFRDLLSKEQIEYFETTLLNFRYWFDEKGNDAMWFFSENHALCFHTGQMLAGELWPEKVFANSGLTGRQQSEKAKTLIVEWFQKLLKYGYNEWNSAAYIPVDMLSYITLLELCMDQEVRVLAKKALDYTFEIFAENSFQGILGTSNGRTYRRDLLANKNLSTNPIMWLAWGKGCLNSNVDPLVYLALSCYQPPKQLEKIACWDKKEKLILRSEQGTLRVPAALCKTKDYILGTCVSPRTRGLGSQEHLLNVFIKDWRSRIWINHPGESKLFGEKRPGYFTGNGLTPLVEQQGNVAVMSYHFGEELLQKAEVDFTHAFCDMSICDQVLVEGNWAFIRREDTFAALYSSNGLRINQKAPLKEKELISPGINTTWLVKVCAVPEVEGFDAFTQWLLNHQPKEKDKKLYFHDFEYGPMKFTLLN